MKRSIQADRSPGGWHGGRTIGLLLALAAAALALVGCAPERLAPADGTPVTEIVIVPAGDEDRSIASATQLADIQSRVPFDFATPSWVPEGFYPSTAIDLASDASWVLFGWEHETGTRIDLVISPQAPHLPDAPPQWVKSTTVNGQPGVLILGLCSVDGEAWDATLQTILAWEAGEIHYALATTGTTATAYDLQRMAESMN
jgi:hypothetical protein